MRELRHQDNPKYKINEGRKVFVYKNLHKDCWSVKQDGLVKMHTHDLSLFDCSFRVNQRGRQQVLEERRKNVHAGISGYIDTPWLMGSQHGGTRVATYNPYKFKSFVRADDDSKSVFWSSAVRMTKNRVEFVPCIDSANQL